MFASLRRFSLISVTLSALAAATACTIDQQKRTVAAPAVDVSSQPATATYSCADGGMITIQNLGASVRILNGADEPLELPASPPTQRSRYGEQPYALVLEGNEALLMKNGAEPLTCTR